MNIGTLLRKHRKEAQLTLKVVAEKASISEGFLSQVENDVNSPSVDTLIRICKALKVDAGELLTMASKKEKIVRIKRTDWEDIDISHTGFATRRFLPPEDRTVIDSSILVIEQAITIPVRKNVKNGQELLCVLRGDVTFKLGEESYDLTEGDCVHFWTNPAHQKITNTGSGRCYIFWAGTL